MSKNGIAAAVAPFVVTRVGRGVSSTCESTAGQVASAYGRKGPEELTTLRCDNSHDTLSL
jgi:hypothetical protein